MRKTFWVAVLVFLFASAGLAQNTVDTTWRCPSPSEMHAISVGDAPNHNFTILQGNCTAFASNTDFPEDKTVFTEFQELRGDMVRVYGRMNVTMKNGDMVNYVYEGSFASDITKPFSQRWKLESGTGRYRLVTGEGTCKGVVHSDSTGEMKCTGTFSNGH